MVPFQQIPRDAFFRDSHARTTFPLRANTPSFPSAILVPMTAATFRMVPATGSVRDLFNLPAGLLSFIPMVQRKG